MNKFEDEYYLLYPLDIKNYPLIYEDCNRLTCSYEKYKKCEKVPDCPAYFNKVKKIENPRPFVLDFFTALTKKKVIYADCYMALSLSKSSFAVSPELYKVLNDLDIEGIQFIPVALLEDNELKYDDFKYVHIYNLLPVLSVKNSRYQEHNGIKFRNNLLEIKFDDKKLSKINLDERLIFKFPLERSYFIFHISVVEKIMTINPAGIQFLKISDINYTDKNGIFL